MKYLIICFSILFINVHSFGQIDTSISPVKLNEGGLLKADAFPTLKSCKGNSVIARENCTHDQLYDFIQKNLKYPSEARDNDIEGFVLVHFIINEKGNIKNLTALNSLERGCTKEALRLVDEMKWKGLTWKAGSRKGKSVSYEILYPIYFDLEKTDRPVPQLEMRIPKKTDDEVTFSTDKTKVFTTTEVDKTPLFPAYECQDLTDRGNTSDYKANQCAEIAFEQFITEHLKYPEAAFEKNLDGKVEISFIVKSNGLLSDVEIISSTTKVFEQPVLKFMDGIQQTIRWIPGERADNKVNVKITMSFYFDLAQEKNKRSNQ